MAFNPTRTESDRRTTSESHNTESRICIHCRNEASRDEFMDSWMCALDFWNVSIVCLIKRPSKGELRRFLRAVIGIRRRA